MAKTLSESAAEILKASMNAAGKEPSQKLPGEMEDLGGQTPSSLPDDYGHKASAEMKAAAKPGTPGVPAEPMKKLPGSEAKKVGDEEENLKKNPVDAGAVKAEETEVEGEVVSEESDESLEEGNTKLAMPMAVKKLGEGEKEDEAEEEDEDEDEDEEDAEEKKKGMMKEMVKKHSKSMKEDVDALFNGESLSEDFRVKATLIFEAAVNSRVESIVEEVLAENDEILASAIEEIKQEMSTQVDEYMNYVVEQWMEENKVAIETGLRSELTEDFINGLKNLFAEHYIEIPDEKVDVAEELALTVAELQEQVTALQTESDEKISSLTEELNSVKKEKAIRKICEGLTETQIAKMKSLAEGVEFTTEGEFNNKLAVIRENYFPANKVKSEVEALQETTVSEDQPEVEEVHGLMAHYVQAIKKTAPKA
jgi:hypothetical protein